MKCDSAACWCQVGPRIIASTGQVYTVAELRIGSRAGRPVRRFRYQYLDWIAR